jgi:hypothetical protein
MQGFIILAVHKLRLNLCDKETKGLLKLLYYSEFRLTLIVSQNYKYYMKSTLKFATN